MSGTFRMITDGMRKVEVYFVTIGIDGTAEDDAPRWVECFTRLWMSKIGQHHRGWEHGRWQATEGVNIGSNHRKGHWVLWVWSVSMMAHASIGVSNNGRTIMLREDKRMVVVAAQGVTLDFQHEWEASENKGTFFVMKWERTEAPLLIWRWEKEDDRVDDIVEKSTREIREATYIS